MPCGSCEYFDEDDKWGEKGYCSYHKSYFYADEKSCSHYKSRSGGGCFMTSACCGYYGLADDCPELTAMRRLRDDHVGRTEEGRAEIEEYYAAAPEIVKRIDASGEKERYYACIMQRLRECLALVEKGEYGQAADIYRDMFRHLRTEFA